MGLAPKVLTELKQSRIRSLRLTGFLATFGLASALCLAAHSYAETPSDSRDDSTWTGSPALPNPVIDSDTEIAILEGNPEGTAPQASLVVIDGLRPAEENPVIEKLARLPGGTIKITHIGPNVPAELQVFIRQLRILNKEREGLVASGIKDKEPFKIEREYIKTPDADAYLATTAPAQLKAEFEKETRDTGWQFRYRNELAKEIGAEAAERETPDRIKSGIKNAWNSASAWVNHIFGVTKKGVTWINYKSKRNLQEAKGERATLFTRLGLVSIFMVYALNAKNAGGAHLNVALPIIMNIIMSIAFDINMKGNREHKAQGKNWNAELNTFEDNQKGYVLISFLHTLIFRQMNALSMNIHPFAEHWYDKITMSLADYWAGLTASVTGQPARLPVDIAFRKAQRRRLKAWEASLRETGLTDAEIETREPPVSWSYVIQTAIWGLVIAAMQVNKQLLAVNSQNGDAHIYRIIDDGFMTLGYLGAGFMFWVNRKSILQAAKNAYHFFLGSKAHCATLLQVTPTPPAK